MIAFLRRFHAEYGTKRLAFELLAGPIVVALIALMLTGWAVVL